MRTYVKKCKVNIVQQLNSTTQKSLVGKEFSVLHTRRLLFTLPTVPNR